MKKIVILLFILSSLLTGQVLTAAEELFDGHKWRELDRALGKSSQIYLRVKRSIILAYKTGNTKGGQEALDPAIPEMSANEIIAALDRFYSTRRNRTTLLPEALSKISKQPSSPKKETSPVLETMPNPAQSQEASKGPQAEW